MWFCIDTFSLNNMLSYYTYTCTAWLWWWHTCTIIFSPRWHKALEFMLPDAKGRGWYNISGLSFYWGTNTVLSPEKTKACSAEPVVVRARQNLWCRYSEFWWAGNLLNTLQNNSMYMHWEIRINYSEMLHREECGIHWQKWSQFVRGGVPEPYRCSPSLVNGMFYCCLVNGMFYCLPWWICCCFKA